MSFRIHTTAPAHYDWTAWTTELGRYTDPVLNDEMRVVEVCDSFHAKSQRERYMSGLYYAAPEPPDWEDPEDWRPSEVA